MMHPDLSACEVCGQPAFTSNLRAVHGRALCALCVAQAAHRPPYVIDVTAREDRATMFRDFYVARDVAFRSPYSGARVDTLDEHRFRVRLPNGGPDHTDLFLRVSLGTVQDGVCASCGRTYDDAPDGACPANDCPSHHEEL